MKKAYFLRDVFVYSFIGIISVVGVLNMYNAINTSLETRKREIVRLITIGMEEKQINKMLFAENGICRNTCINIRNCYWNLSVIYSLFSEH